tara:strand:+ start:518 stop:1063 length:546 start_codon:yes stop_codon:yes gene_type:complete
MANKKITELTALTTAASDDVLAIVDVSGTAETKKITVANLTGSAGILTQRSTTVTNAEVLTMKYNNLPITLVDAEAGKIHVPVSVTFVATWGSPNENSSDDMRVGWDAATSTSADYFNTIRDFMHGISSGTHTLTCSPFANAFGNVYPASAVNQPVQAWCSDNFLGGWDMIIYTTYYSITV